MTFITARRSLLLGGIATAATGLAACSGLAGSSSGAPSASSAAATGGKVSLLLVDQPATKDLQARIIPKFTQATGTQVEVELVPESGLEAKLATAVTGSSSQYDVLMTGVGQWASLVGRGAIAPLDDYIANEHNSDYIKGFPDSLLQNLALRGKRYAMPYTVGAELLYVNTDLYSKAGLDPSQLPKTLDDVVAAADAIKAKTGVPGFVGRGTRNANENSFLWIMMWYLLGGRWPAGADPSSFDVLTAAPAIKATTAYLHLLTADGPAGAANLGFAESQIAMQQGKAGMWLDAAQLGPALELKDKSTIAGKVGYAALAGTGGSDYIVGAVWGLSIATATKATGQAWNLVKYLTGKETGLAQLTTGANGSCGRSDVLNDPAAKSALNPGFATALSNAVAHTNPLYTPAISQGSKIRAALALELSSSLSSGRPAEETMKAAQAAVQAALK